MAARADSGFVINDGVLLRYEGDAQHVTIPDSVKRIGDAAFMGCSPSISVTPISDSVSAVGFRPDHTAGCGSSLLSVTIPDSVTAIGRAAFAGCSTLVSVTIPDSGASIGYGAFMHCTSLVSLTIPDSVTEIGDDAFRGCTSLVSLTIPDSVVSIGEGAFEGCTSLVPGGGEIDVGEFLGACASGDIETVTRLARELDPDNARDVLAQGITVAAMSGATEVVEFLQPIADVLGADSGPRDDSSLHAKDAQNAGSAEESKRDRTARQQAPKKSKKDSATPYAAELKALASRDEDARQEAGQTLYDAGEAALPALIEGLSARSRESRKWCAGLLKEHARYGESFVRDPQVVEALAARLDDPDWETRRYRAAALGYIGTPDALAHLREVRDSEDEVTRAAALAGLYAAGDEEAHAQLLEMVADASADGRWAAVVSLDLVSKPGVDLDVLKSALSDRSKYVRQAAESAISNLESQGEQDTDDAVHHARASEGRSRPVETAAEALVELLSATSPDDTANAQERLRAVTHFASFGVKAVDALEEFFVDPYRKYGISEDQLRHIAWAFARIDEAGSAQRILDFAMGMYPEFIVQALRAIARPGVAHTVDRLVLVKLGSLLGDISEEEPLYNDSLFALAMLFDSQNESASGEGSDWASFLLGHFETAMRWERRIHLEREYGILGAELDPLYGRVERVLRSMKGPYYFRPSEVRASRLAARGIDAEGLVLTEEQVSRVRLGDVVTTVLEYEYEHGLHVSHVRVRVDEEPRETSDGRLFRGTVQSVEPWAGPYELREGERVWFLGAHVHGEQD